MTYVLGVDQGSSNTRAAIADLEGNILGYARSGGACHSLHGMEKAMRMVTDAVESAVCMAGIEPEQIQLMYAGMTGADFPDEYDLLAKELKKSCGIRQLTVKNDCIPALRGGTSKPYGIIVAAGSGCNCAIISPSGEEFIYQYFVEDSAQGGSAISRKILDAIYQSYTFRIPETLLTKAVLSWLGYKDVLSLLRKDVEKTMSPAERLGIVPLLFEASCKGDAIARSIIVEQAKSMALLVKGGVERYQLHQLSFEVVISGSIFKGKGNLIQETFKNEVLQFAPNATIVDALYEPVVGAVLLGIEQLKGPATSPILKNIDGSSDLLFLKRTQHD